MFGWLVLVLASRAPPPFSAPRLLLDCSAPRYIYSSTVRRIPLLRFFVWSRFWLLPPGLGLADSLPPVIEFLRILCCSISSSCYSKLVVFVASKFNRSLVDSIASVIRLVKVLAAASRSGFGGYSTSGHRIFADSLLLHFGLLLSQACDLCCF